MTQQQREHLAAVKRHIVNARHSTTRGHAPDTVDWQLERALEHLACFDPPPDLPSVLTDEYLAARADAGKPGCHCTATERIRR